MNTIKIYFRIVERRKICCSLNGNYYNNYKDTLVRSERVLDEVDGRMSTQTASFTQMNLASCLLTSSTPGFIQMET